MTGFIFAVASGIRSILSIYFEILIGLFSSPKTVPLAIIWMLSPIGILFIANLPSKPDPRWSETHKPLIQSTLDDGAKSDPSKVMRKPAKYNDLVLQGLGR